MAAQIFLTAPDNALPGELAKSLAGLLTAAPIAALLLPVGTRPPKAYAELVKVVLPIAQPAGCAVLLEGEPGLVEALGADGLHVAGGAKALKTAIMALKPTFIVGAGGIKSRHEAMILGELGPDYVMFGPLSGPIEAISRQLAQWWAQTMEISAVLNDPEALAATTDTIGCEFLGLSDSIWAAGEEAPAMLAAIHARLEAR